MSEMSRNAMALLTWVLICTYLHRVGSAVPTKRNKLRDVDWFSEGQKSVRQLLGTHINSGVAKNVIFFIGDGMGAATSSASRLLKAQLRETSLFNTKLAWEEFPFTALAMPYEVDQFTAESAGTASAFLTGVKTNAGMVGLNHRALRARCETVPGNEVDSLLHYSDRKGKWTGIITTDTLVGATPSAAYASSPERNYYSDVDTPPGCKDLAAQLIEENHFIRVLLGGGREFFTGINDSDVAYQTPGRRMDRNLIKVWKETQSLKAPESTVKFVTNQTDFDAVDPNTVQYLMGMFEGKLMHYECDRKDPSLNKDAEPSMSEMTEKAILVLRRNKKGYFLLVEGANIDNGHHAGNAYRALHDTLAMSEAVQKAVSLTDAEDTLIVVSADHSHTFVINGYPHPDNDIFGLVRKVVKGTEDEVRLVLAEDGLPYETLSYGNGPGYLYHHTNETIGRRNLTQDEAEGITGEKGYLQATAVPLLSETHGGEDVVVYARGPMAHLVRGVQEQSNIAHIMMYASCVGPNQDHCVEMQARSPAPYTLPRSTGILIVVIIWMIWVVATRGMVV